MPQYCFYAVFDQWCIKRHLLTSIYYCVTFDKSCQLQSIGKKKIEWSKKYRMHQTKDSVDQEGSFYVMKNTTFRFDWLKICRLFCGHSFNQMNITAAGFENKETLRLKKLSLSMNLCIKHNPFSARKYAIIRLLCPDLLCFFLLHLCFLVSVQKEQSF